MSTDNPIILDGSFLRLREKNPEEKVRASDKKLRKKYTGTRKGFSAIKKARGEK